MEQFKKICKINYKVIKFRNNNLLKIKNKHQKLQRKIISSRQQIMKDQSQQIHAYL